MSITRDQYQRARHITEHAADLLFEAIRPDKRGRPTLHPRIYLTGLVLSIDTNGMSTVAEIHRLLTHDLDPQLQWDLGVRRRDKRGHASALTRTHLYALTRRITETLDHTKVRGSELADAERHRRRAALDAVSDALLDATLTRRPEGSTAYALDGSAIWAAERAPSALTSRTVTDPQHEEDLDTLTSTGDADTGPSPVGTANQGASPSAGTDSSPVNGSACPAGPDPTSDVGSGRARRRRPSDAAYGAKTAKDGRRNTYFGYNLEAFVRVPLSKDSSSDKRTEPALAERIVVLPASTDIVGPDLELIDRMRSQGTVITTLLVDRHYSYKRFDRWLKELTLRGIKQVADAHQSDQGFRDWDGMLIAASWPHCPHTPIGLGNLPSPGPTATKEQKREFSRKIAERQQYAAQRHTRMDKRGRVRYQCPALNGTVGCQHYPETEEAAHVLGLPIIHRAPGGQTPPAICTQKTVQLSITTPEQSRAMKLYQEFYWGSPEWIALYGTRTYVEGWFGTFKSHTATGLRRGTYHYAGAPLVTILLLCAAAVTNMRLLRSWHEETGLGDITHPLLTPDEEFYGFTQLTREQLAVIDRPHDDPQTVLGPHET